MKLSTKLADMFNSIKRRVSPPKPRYVSKAFAVLGLAFFSMGDCCTCIGGGGTSTGPSITGVVPIDDPVSVNSSLQTGCTVPPSSATQDDTPAAQYTFSYSDGTSRVAPETWPKGNGSTPATLTVWIDPNDSSGPYQYAQQAAQFWQSQLTTGNPGTMLLSLATDTNALDRLNANVQVFDTTDRQDWPGSALNPLPDEGGSNTITYSTNSAQLLFAYVILQAGNGPQTTYESALHELGHALGLNHSIWQWSVMYPYTSYCISTSSTSMATQDKDYLWKTYDPKWTIPPKVNQCVETGVCGGHIYQAISANPKFSGKMAYIVPRGHRVPATAASYALRVARSLARSEIPGHPRALFHMVEDNDHHDSLSTDSLWLSSSLVSNIQILGEVTRRSGDLYTTVYRAARVNQIYKHLYSPDATVKPGDTIVLAQQYLPGGDEIRDDLTLGPNDGNVMVFLRRSGLTTNYDGKNAPVYVTTSMFNSKFKTMLNGAIAPLSLRQTVINKDMTTRTLTSALMEFRDGPNVPKSLTADSLTFNFNEATAVQRLLSRNGYNSRTGLEEYQRMMFGNPHALYEKHALRDAAVRGIGQHRD